MYTNANNSKMLSVTKYLYLTWLLSKVNYATMHKANCNFLPHCLAVSSALPQEYVSIPLDYTVLYYSKN